MVVMVIVLSLVAALVMGWTFGALWAHHRTNKCEECGEYRICPKCRTMNMII